MNMSEACLYVCVVCSELYPPQTPDVDERNERNVSRTSSRESEFCIASKYDKTFPPFSCVFPVTRSIFQKHPWVHWGCCLAVPQAPRCVTRRLCRATPPPLRPRRPAACPPFTTYSPQSPVTRLAHGGAQLWGLSKVNTSISHALSVNMSLNDREVFTSIPGHIWKGRYRAWTRDKSDGREFGFQKREF